MRAWHDGFKRAEAKVLKSVASLIRPVHAGASARRCARRSSAGSARIRRRAGHWANGLMLPRRFPRGSLSRTPKRSSPDWCRPPYRGERAVRLLRNPVGRGLGLAGSGEDGARIILQDLEPELTSKPVPPRALPLRLGRSGSSRTMPLCAVLTALASAIIEIGREPGAPANATLVRRESRMSSSGQLTGLSSNFCR